MLDFLFYLAKKEGHIYEKGEGGGGGGRKREGMIHKGE